MGKSVIGNFVTVVYAKVKNQNRYLPGIRQAIEKRQFVTDADSEHDIQNLKCQCFI